MLVTVLAGVFARLQSTNQPGPEAIVDTETALNLGFNYLNITPTVSAYYGLNVDCGALVTEVAPGSPADRVGVKPGDVILSFNNVQVQDDAPLFGMMMDCPTGSRIVLEVFRGETSRFIELTHIAR